MNELFWEDGKVNKVCEENADILFKFDPECITTLTLFAKRLSHHSIKAKWSTNIVNRASTYCNQRLKWKKQINQ